MKKALKKFGKCLEEVNLQEHNTFKIGGKAKYMVKPDTTADLKDLLEFLKEQNMKYFILGNGSNIIFSDEYYDGVVIKLDRLNTIEVYSSINSVFAEAGAMMGTIVNECLTEGLTGLEWAAGIPGTIGGSTIGNAGAYKSCIFDHIKFVTIIDENGELKKLSKEEITYDYRTSMFKDNKNIVVVMVELELPKGDKKQAKELLEDRKRRRMESQPLNYPSAGSVFRNPEGDYAGRLIEECGLKGKQIGGAMISDKHANFIVNVSKASAKDVRDLVKLAHDEVLKKFNIDLIVEQEFID